MTTNKLKIRVMRRVYVLFFARKAVGATAMKIYTLLLSSVGIVSLVSVGNIVSNMPNIPQSSASEVFSFVFYALTHTEFVVQLLIVATLTAVLWLTRDIIRGFHYVPQLKRV